eukprot:6281408-Amphidinium_carterae.1
MHAVNLVEMMSWKLILNGANLRSEHNIDIVQNPALPSCFQDLKMANVVSRDKPNTGSDKHIDIPDWPV